MVKRVSLKGRGADIFFGDEVAPAAPAPADEAVSPPSASEHPSPLAVVRMADLAPARRPDQPTRQLEAPSTSQSIDQSIGQLTERSTDQSIPPFIDTSPSASPVDDSPVLGKPKGFYITERQDEDLNGAVTKLAARLKGRGNQKIDRSTIVRLLLEDADLLDDQTINRLANRFIRRLVSQLTN